jgi:hypothetical protein
VQKYTFLIWCYNSKKTIKKKRSEYFLGPLMLLTSKSPPKYPPKQFGKYVVKHLEDIFRNHSIYVKMRKLDIGRLLFLKSLNFSQISFHFQHLIQNSFMDFIHYLSIQLHQSNFYTTSVFSTFNFLFVNL